MEKSSPRTIPILDLYFSAYQAARGNPPTLQKRGNKVVFLFPADAVFDDLAAEYHSGEVISAIEFVNSIRRLRAQMIALRENGGGATRQNET